LQVHFCGVRGSLPAAGKEFVRYGGHTSCLALAIDGGRAPTLFLDAGTGLLRAFSLLNGAPFEGSLLLTHLHWDHVVGLPFFAVHESPDMRVDLMLPEQESGADAATTLAGLMSPPYFPIGPSQLCGHWTFSSLPSGESEIEGFTVLAREIPHKGGRTYGYRVSVGDAAIAYMPDHNPTALVPGEDGLGEYHPAALELARDADLLVHDAQLLPEELAAEARFGHAAADYAVALAERAGTRAVTLFHHRLDRTDDELDRLAARLAKHSSAVSVAAEGVVLDL